MIKKIMKRFALSEEGAKGFVQAVIACTASNLGAMLPVGLLYFLVNDLMKGAVEQRRYVFYAVGIVAAVVLIFLTAFWQYNATYFTTYKESGTRRIRLAEKLRKLPLSFFGKKDLADLTNTIMGDSATMEQMFSHYVPQYYGAVISATIVSVGLCFYDIRLALAAVWVLPVSLIIVGVTRKAQNRYNAKQRQAEIALADSVQECLEAVRDLKSNNAEKDYLVGLYEKVDEAERRHMKSEFGIAAYVVPAQMILKLGIATVALVGGALLMQGKVTLLIFFMFLLVVSRIYEPIMGALQNLAAMISLDVNIERMAVIENGYEQTGSNEFNPDGYDIEFSNVSFAYNEGENVLNGVSFTAKQGEVTALIGESGGGKSTAAKLAARFWDVDNGTVKVGGIDVKTVDPEKLLSAFSIVFQDVNLFNNTVMENIRIGRKGATDEEVFAAAKQAQCDEFISRLPEGYNTVIGENGSTLSGGERQRISIARALLKDAPIILLDEATASLDAENETEIQQAISKLIQDKTVLIIAHRMRTVEGADHLVLLKDGLVAEEGTPEQLKAKNGLFARMVAHQSEGQRWTING